MENRRAASIIVFVISFISLISFCSNKVFAAEESDNTTVLGTQMIMETDVLEVDSEQDTVESDDSEPSYPNAIWEGETIIDSSQTYESVVVSDNTILTIVPNETVHVIKGISITSGKTLTINGNLVVESDNSSAGNIGIDGDIIIKNGSVEVGADKSYIENIGVKGNVLIENGSLYIRFGYNGYTNGKYLGDSNVGIQGNVTIEKGELTIYAGWGMFGSDGKEGTGERGGNGGNGGTGIIGDVVNYQGSVSIVAGDGGSGGRGADGYSGGSGGNGGCGGDGIKGNVTIFGGTLNSSGGDGGLFGYRGTGSYYVGSDGRSGWGGDAINGTVTVNGGQLKATAGEGVSSPFTQFNSSRGEAISSRIINAYPGTQYYSGGSSDIIPTSTSGQLLSSWAISAEFIPHSHSFQYVAGKNEEINTITAYCIGAKGYCDLSARKITLNAPTDLIYDGMEKNAYVSNYPEEVIPGLNSVSDISYFTTSQEGSTTPTGALEGAPKDAGNYVAQITWGGKTAKKAFTIEKAEADMVAYAEDVTVTYDGYMHGILVHVEHPVDAFNIKYGTTTNCSMSSSPRISSVADSPLTVYYKVTSKNYKDVVGSARVIISKAPQEAPVAPSMLRRTAASVELVPKSGYEYKSETGEWQTSNVICGLSPNKSYTFYQRVAADENHNASDSSRGTIISTLNHVHIWKYTADGDQITAACLGEGECVVYNRKFSITLNAPSNLVYNSLEKSATISGYPANVNTGLEGKPTIQYYRAQNAGSTTVSGSALSSAPINAGNYVAQINWGGKTAKKAFTIEKATIIASSEDISIEYDGKPHGINVEVTTPINGANIKYGTTNGNYNQNYSPTIKNVADGPLTVYYKVSAENYVDVTGSARVTISKSTPDAPVAPTKKSITATSVTLNPKTGYEYKCGTGEWQTSNTFTGLSPNTNYTFFQRICGDSNHNVSNSSSGTAICTAKHEHNWVYSASGSRIIASCYGEGYCDVANKSIIIEINTPTSLIYDSKEKVATITGYPTSTVSGLESMPVIEYYKTNYEGSLLASGSALSSAPINAGNYVAQINWGGKTAKKAFTIEKATIIASSEDISIEYDGKPHGINVEVTTPINGANIKYGTTNGNYNQNYSPTIKNVADGPLTVYYKVSAENYVDVTGSARVTISKSTPDAPAAPTMSRTTSTSITLTPIDGYEYRCGTDEWQTSNTFTGLKVNIEYIFYQRIKETNNVNASPDSVGTAICTNKEDASLIAPMSKKNLVYNQQMQELIDPGLATGGTILYALSTENPTIVPEIWDTKTPTGKDAGVYYIWYKIVGDDTHYDSEPNMIEACIDKVPVMDKTDLTTQQKPIARENLIYSGKEMELLTVVDALPDGYVNILYSFDEGNTWTDEIPTASKPGSYKIHVKYVGDNNHYDFEGSIVSSSINRIEWEPINLDMFAVSNATSIYAKDAVITGVDNTMEYSIDNGIHWIKTGENSSSINNLGAGRVVIRKAEDDYHNPGNEIYVLIRSEDQKEGEKVFVLCFYSGNSFYRTMEVLEGDVIDEIVNPSDSDNFLGWYLDGKLWDPTTPVTTDLILYAHFADDDVAVTAMDTQPDTIADEEDLTLVKGQKFIWEAGKWYSSDQSSLSVAKNGTITAKKVTSSVRLSDWSNSKTYRVKICQPSVDKSMKVYVGDKKRLSIYESYNLPVTWVSANPDVASVSTDGTVCGISKGSTTITAYVNGMAYNCKVSVADANTSSKSPYGTVKLVPMQSFTVKTSGFKAKNATWSSDLPSVHYSKLGKGVVYENDVVRIYSSGKLTAIGVGTTELKASGGGTTLNFTVQVSDPVTKTIHMNTNTTKSIKIYGTKGNLNWKSSNSSVVQINGNQVKGIRPGMTELTAKYENLEYKVVVYVEDPSITTSKVYGLFPKYSLTLSAGSSIVLTERQTYQNVLYKSNKNNIAFVDEAGVLTARSRGTAKITAKVNGKKVTITVNVT